MLRELRWRRLPERSSPYVFMYHFAIELAKNNMIKRMKQEINPILLRLGLLLYQDFIELRIDFISFFDRAKISINQELNDCRMTNRKRTVVRIHFCR